VMIRTERGAAVDGSPEGADVRFFLALEVVMVWGAPLFQGKQWATVIPQISSSFAFKS